MSQQYALPCSCGTQLSVEVRQAGGTTACAGCSAVVDVPRLRDMKLLEPIGETPKPKRTWSQQQGILFACGLLFAAIAVGSAFYTYKFRQIYDIQRPDASEIRFPVETQDIELMDSWKVWKGYKRKNASQSVLNRPPPQHVRAQERVKAMDLWLTMYAVLGGLGLLLMGLSFVLRPKSTL